jgi:hypothetical protein
MVGYVLAAPVCIEKIVGLWWLLDTQVYSINKTLNPIAV